MFHNSISFVALALGLGAFALYKFIVYPAFLSPLSKIPNAHWSSPISPAWILWVRWRGRANQTIDDAHRQVGPVVRLAPNEVNVNCVENGLKTIYAGGFEKPDWYLNQFSNYGFVNSGPSILVHAVASISKTLIFSNLLPFLHAAVEKSQPFDILELYTASSMDFVTAYLYGLRCYVPAVPNLQKRRLNRYSERWLFTFWLAEAPVVGRWARYLGFPVVPKWVDEVNDLLEEWTLEMCDSAERLLEGEGCVSNEGDEPTVYAKLRSELERADDKTPLGRYSVDGPFPSRRLDIASEMLDHTGAGLETSGITLAYLTYELSVNPDAQARLREELLTLTPKVVSASQPSLPSFSELDALPFLHAVLMETLRLHHPIPGGQPRVTPSTPCTLGEFGNIPPGVRVNAQAYSLHQQEAAFPRANEWIPERWLADGLQGETERKESWFWAFGSGGRICIGKNLANLAMKLTVAAVYSGFTTSVVGGESMKQMDTYTAGPSDGKLLVRLSTA